MTRYTLVCTPCSRGWDSDSERGTCDRCGAVAQVRGRYEVVELRRGTWSTS